LTRPSPRIAGIDLARALALLGMVFVNYKYLMEADENGDPLLLWLTDWIDGRPAAAFVILAGVGISLLKNYSLKANGFQPFARPYATILKRAVFLFFFGLMFSRIWYADILHFYGAYFALALFLVDAPAYFLVTLSSAALVTTLLFSSHFTFTALPKIESVWEPGFWTQKGFLEDLFVNGCYPVFPWIVYLLIGIWLGRQNLENIRLQKKILLFAALGVVFAEVFAWLVENVLITDSTIEIIPLLIFFLDTSPFSSSILSVFSAAGTALLVIVMSIKVAKKAGASKWLKPFLATAQMSLTLYIVHIAIFQLIQMIVGQGEINSRLEVAWISAAVFCILAIPFANFWVNHFGRGPFEKILRWVSK
jgi:uncharacterized membrane protein YeiB